MAEEKDFRRKRPRLLSDGKRTDDQDDAENEECIISLLGNENGGVEREQHNIDERGNSFNRIHTSWKTPTEKPEGVKHIQLRMNLFDIPEIDTKAQSFVLRFYYEVAWDAICEEDRNFAHKVCFGNIVGSPEAVEEWDAEEKNYHSSGKWLMMKRFKLTAKFMSQLSLHNFPFDVQYFKLNLRTDLPNGEAWLLNNELLPSTGNVHHFTTSNEYNFVEGMYCSEEMRRGSRASFSHVIYKIVAHRKPGFIINNVFLPILVISGLGLTVFAFSHTERNEDFDNRFSINGSLLLTLVAYKFATSNNLPAVNYMTFADMYVLFSMGFQAGLILWSAILVSLIEPENQDSADSKAFYTFSTVWAIWVIYSVVLVILYRRNLAHQLRAEHGGFGNFLGRFSFLESFFPITFSTDVHGKGEIFIPFNDFNPDEERIIFGCCNATPFRKRLRRILCCCRSSTERKPTTEKDGSNPATAPATPMSAAPSPISVQSPSSQK